MSQTIPDQAEQLRRLIDNGSGTPEESGSRVIAVASGKGGVGKSNVCINFGLGLRAQGKRVLILDADVGFADVEVLLGVHPKHTIVDVLDGMSIWDAIEYDSSGLPFLSAGNGITDIHDLSREQMSRLIRELTQLQERFDIILIDSGAGMGQNIGQLISAADDVFLVTTPEPTSVADAYALMKMLVARGNVPPTSLLVNRAHNFVGGRETADKLQLAISRFLDKDVSVLGYILEDPNVSRAVMNQMALLEGFPDSSASRCFRQLVKNYLRLDAPHTEGGGFRRFIDRLFHRVQSDNLMGDAE